MRPEAAAMFILAFLSALPAAEAASHQTYAGFAQPVASYSLSARNISFATAADAKTISLSASDYAVYKYAYVSTDGQAWKLVPLSGNALGGLWLNGSVTGQLPLTAANFSLTQSRLSTARNFVVVYTCSRNSTGWDCHSGWQIWQFDASMLSPYPAFAKVTGVSASTNDGHLPEWTLDGDFSDESRWSGNGDGARIQYELNETALVDSVSIAAWDGTCSFIFDISVSIDGSAWTQVYSGRSDGMDNGLEKFAFTATPARFVRITGHGNNGTYSSWNSYIEVRIDDFPIGSFQTGVYCGDGTCNGGETCSTCDSDCGGCGGGDDIAVIYYNSFEQNTIGSDSYKNDWTNCYGNEDSRIERFSSDYANPTKVFWHHFPQGTWSLGNGEGAFCEYITENGRNEAYFSYKIKFGGNFDPVHGGKLPSLSGMESGVNAGTCPDGTDEFNALIMFHGGPGMITPSFYLYYPDQWNSTWYREGYSYDSMSDPPENCDEAMERICELECHWWADDVWQDSAYDGWRNAFVNIYGRNPNDCTEFAFFVIKEMHDGTFCGIYGESFPWALMSSGQWYTITERIVANTPGEHNGIIEGFIDGRLVSQVTGLRLRDVDYLKINRIELQTFFGGGGSQYATSKDEDIYFDDLIFYYYTPSSGQITGNAPSPAGRVLPQIDYPDESPITG
jgi:hypothetical protein